MRHFLEEYSLISGLILFSIILIVLLSSQESIFSNLSIVDTSLSYKTSNEVWVKSLFNLTLIQDKTMVLEFPKIISRWEGVQFHAEEERAMKVFMTNTVLIRKYYDGERSVQFILVKGENNTDVMHPVKCFGKSWNITEKGIESLQPDGWTTALNVNKLYSKRENTTEIVLYWFMWGPGGQRSIRNCVMIMLSMPVYFNESENTALIALRDFASEIIPKMYVYQPKSDIIGKELINNFGILGAVIEILLIGLSLALVFYNKLWKSR